MSECIIWTRGCFQNGYGSYKGKYIHRYIWEQHNGPIPKGMMIRHICHNRKCYNIEHLAIGTHQDNRDDDMATGHKFKMISGENQWQAKLKHNDIDEIKSYYGKLSGPKVAKLYGVDPTQIYRIWKNTAWRTL